MRLTKKVLSGLLSMSLSVTLLTGIPFNVNGNGIKAKAESTAQTRSITVLETDVLTASEGCTMLGVYGSYYSQAQAALDRINEIRKEACEAGNVPDPRDEKRMLAPGDYVPIKWSTDLESTARIRAMEGGLAFSFLPSGHSRLNGKDIWSVQYNGVSSSAENLAYNWGTDMVYGINQWYEEMEDWIKQTGAVTGHYTSLINPKHTYVGLGDFYTEAAKYPNTLAGAFGTSTANLNQTMQESQTDIIQKIEVQNSYIKGYVLEGNNSIDKGSTTELELRVNLETKEKPIKTLKLWMPVVTYASSDDSVAQVTDDGIVTGVNNGTATITAKSGNYELANIVITVKTAATTAPSATPSQKPGVSPLPEATPSPSPSPSGSVSPSPAATPSQKPSPSPSPSASTSQNQGGGSASTTKPTQKPSPSPSPTVKPTQRPTASPSPTARPSQTPSPVQGEVKNPDAGYEKPSGINVRYHTQAEIKEYSRKSNVALNDALEFAVNPVTTSPYSLGKLSDKTLQSALKMLNQTRYIAGIQDNVILSDEYNTLCQAAALANYANRELTHYPSKPAGMSGDMYALAQKGASSSNLSMASWAGRSLNNNIITGWLNDGDSSNIDRAGHRRWILNPGMGKTGFGAASGENGTYSALYALDHSNSTATEYGVLWPAQNMPVEYFGTSFPWSVSMGYTANKNTVKVTLTRKNDGKTWNFSNSYSDGAFYVNNDGYGQKGCIIFRPDNITYNAGDLFKVKITGLKEDVSYTVNFFNLNSVKATATPSPTFVAKPTQKPEASPSAKPSAEPAATPSYTAPAAGPEDTWPEETEPEETPGTEPEAPANTASKVNIGKKVSAGGVNYKVTSVNSSKTVECTGAKEKLDKVVIPASVRINGQSYKVTSIAKNGFKGSKKLSKITIGPNIKKIGKNAFLNCKNLKNIVIKTKKLTAKTVGKNAFKGIKSKASFKVPDGKVLAYKKIIKQKGAGRHIKVIK